MWLDFFIWEFVKDTVYKMKILNIDDLKFRVITTIAANMLVHRMKSNSLDILCVTKDAYGKFIDKGYKTF